MRAMAIDEILRLHKVKCFGISIFELELLVEKAYFAERQRLPTKAYFATTEGAGFFCTVYGSRDFDLVLQTVGARIHRLGKHLYNEEETASCPEAD